jgi:Domain of unknown function (DUF6745)
MPASSLIDALSAEQTAALERYRARWAAIRRSTERADRKAAEDGARLAYRLAGLAPPARFVWCESPLALARLAGRASRADGANVRSAVVDRPRRKVVTAVRRRLDRRVRAMVEGAVNPRDLLVATATEVVMRATPQEDVTLLRYLREARPLSPSFALRTLLGHSGLRYDAAGQHDLAFLGAYEYLRNVVGLRAETAPLAGLWQLATSGGWVQPHQNTCWLAERPQILRGDAEGRLHCASGPALQFGDGWSAWAWKSVEVPRWVIERPERITLAAIDVEDNVQVRRCMIEIMTPACFVELGGAARIAEDETGILWRKIWLTYDAWAAVEVINATPEPDGTHKHYFLQVPPDMRTAREAVAWTYGLTPRAYSRLVVRT